MVAASDGGETPPPHWRTHAPVLHPSSLSVHGSPLLRAAFAFLLLLLLSLPLWRLTHPAEARPIAQAPVKAGENKAIHLQLSFTQTPTAVRVLSLGKEIWNEKSPAGEMTHDLTLAYPKEGIDLDFQIDWPGDALSAARIRLQNPDGKELDKTIWGKGQTDEVVTFE